MSRQLLTGADLNNQRLTRVADGVNPTDGVNKQQLDSGLRGLDWKQEVVAASTGNVSLAAPGASVDGVGLAAGDRVLLKDQTAPAENGIYQWTAAGAALTRTPDADSGPELSGSTVTVQRGTVNADRVYRVTTDDPLVLNTTAVTWVQVGGATQAKTAGAGLTESATTYDVGAGTGILVTADQVAIDPAVVTRKVAFDVGGATSVTLQHNLGTRDVQVTVYDKATFEEVLPDVIHTDANNIQIVFAVAPASGAYRAVVQG